MCLDFGTKLVRVTSLWKAHCWTFMSLGSVSVSCGFMPLERKEETRNSQCIFVKSFWWLNPLLFRAKIHRCRCIISTLETQNFSWSSYKSVKLKIKYRRTVQKAQGGWSWRNHCRCLVKTDLCFKMLPCESYLNLVLVGGSDLPKRQSNFNGTGQGRAGGDTSPCTVKNISF